MLPRVNAWQADRLTRWSVVDASLFVTKIRFRVEFHPVPSHSYEPVGVIVVTLQSFPFRHIHDPSFPCTTHL